MSFPNMNTSIKINKRKRVSTFDKMENFKKGKIFKFILIKKQHLIN